MRMRAGRAVCLWGAVSSIMWLAGCGLEAAGTAATGAAVKQQELKQGQAAKEQFERQLGEALQQGEQRRRDMDEGATER